MDFRRDEHIEDVAEDAVDKRLAVASRWFAFNYQAGIVSDAKEFAQRPIAAVDLRNFKRPMRIVGHVPAVRRVQQKRHRRVSRAAVGMLLREAHELIRDAAQRV